MPVPLSAISAVRRLGKSQAHLPKLMSIVNGDQRGTGHTRLHGFKYRYSTGPSHRGSILDVSTFRRSGLEDLPKIIFDRDGRLPTLIFFQSAAVYWGETLPDRFAAGFTGKSLYYGHRICIGDFDMYKVIVPLEPDD